ncbi:MAG: hypothetical protein KKH02_13640 [Proteobacteria bacterium]|nr:hypothetical protein [Pseudomonadota bacterium]MCG2741110.1 hypothetical protein [Syntrophaceae bacterium]
MNQQQFNHSQTTGTSHCYAAARWIACDDPKRLAEFEKKCQANLARDADGHLTYLATSEWRLGFIMEEWPDIAFRKTREHL